MKEAAGGRLETAAETRYSDFLPDGSLHFSKALMYFEKARFVMAEKTGIMEALRAVKPEAEFAFVVIRVRLWMREPVVLPRGMSERPLQVRTRLESLRSCRMSFRQELADPADGRVLTEGALDVVILENGAVMRHLPPEVLKCLEPSAQERPREAGGFADGEATFPAEKQAAAEITERVRLTETDPYGVAHHSSYAVWAELGLQSLLSGAAARDACRVTAFDCKYLRSAKAGDLLRIRAVREAEHRFGFEILRDETVLAQGTLSAGFPSEKT